MAYIDRILQPDERVLAVGKMHWVIYTVGVLLIVLGLAVVFAAPNDNTPLRVIGGLIAGGGVIHAFLSWFEQWTTEIVVTSKRVVQKRGFIRRKTAEMNMDKVESVIVDQTLLGRILGYGSVVIRGTGAGIEGLHHIARPLDLRSAIVVR